MLPADQYRAVCNGSQDTGLHKKRAVCRYYQTGNCRRGSSCPFAHFSVATQVESPTIPHPPYQGEHMHTYQPLAQTPVYPLGSQVHPVFLWQPYTPLSPSFDTRYGLACQAEILPDDPDDKNDPSSPESSSTATSMDYQLRMPLDTAWLEGVELRAVASPPDDLGTNLSPGYAGYNYPVIPVAKTEYVVGRDATSGQYVDQGSMVALPSPFLLPWQDDPRKKPLAYKTKPCKFYAANGKCTNGKKCTFIHDLEAQGNVKKSPPKLALPTDAKLPSKPLNKYDDCRARDYYPVTWRVIGGGVMMGGQRQICPAFAAGRCKYGEDCRLAHETELETDQVGFIERKDVPVQKGKGSPQQPIKGTTLKRVRSSSQRRSANVPSLEASQPENFPSTTPRSQRPDVLTLEGIGKARKKGDVVAASSAPTSPVHRRTQSMTMVLPSPSSLDTMQSNYAAEL